MTSLPTWGSAGNWESASSWARPPYEQMACPGTRTTDTETSEPSPRIMSDGSVPIDHEKNDVLRGNGKRLRLKPIDIDKIKSVITDKNKSAELDPLITVRLGKTPRSSESSKVQPKTPRTPKKQAIPRQETEEEKALRLKMAAEKIIRKKIFADFRWQR
jgi:hypothetical protein